MYTIASRERIWEHPLQRTYYVDVAVDSGQWYRVGVYRTLEMAYAALCRAREIVNA